MMLLDVIRARLAHVDALVSQVPEPERVRLAQCIAQACQPAAISDVELYRTMIVLAKALGSLTPSIVRNGIYDNAAFDTITATLCDAVHAGAASARLQAGWSPMMAQEPAGHG